MGDVIASLVLGSIVLLAMAGLFVLTGNVYCGGDVSLYCKTSGGQFFLGALICVLTVVFIAMAIVIGKPILEYTKRSFR